MCESDLDEKRHCKKFGQHCAKAHGDYDLRIPKRTNKNEVLIISDEINNEIDVSNQFVKMLNGFKENDNNDNDINNTEISDISNNITTGDL